MPRPSITSAETKAIRIKDVASAAGVSPATVSLVYNNKGEVARATRKKVLETGERLGYRANPLGRALRTGQSRILGIIVSYRESPVWQETYLPYYREIIADAAIEAMEHGYSVAAASPGSSNFEASIANLDGVIIVDPLQDDAIVEHCAARGIPLVSDGGFVGGKRSEKHMSVLSNIEGYLRDILNVTASQFSKRHGKPLKSISLFTGSTIDQYTADTERVFTNWCIENRILPQITTLRPGGNVDDLAKNLLTNIRPEAIYCLNESYSGAVLAAAAELDLSIPADLVLSSEATSPHATRDPRVNYVEATDEDGAGKLAVRLLVEFLETGTARDSIVEFRLRASRASNN